MISTAVALQEATGNAIIDLSTLMLAKEMYENKDSMTSEEFSQALFNYSAHLASVTATLVVNAVMTQNDIDSLLDTLVELEEMGNISE